MRRLLLLLYLSVVTVSFSQEKEERTIPVDSLFREDQFYFSITYNLLRNAPSGYSQYSFSSGVTSTIPKAFF